MAPHPRSSSDHTPTLRLGLAALALAAGVVAAVGSLAPAAVDAQPITLRPLADDAGLALGAAIDATTLEDDAYRRLLSEHVNLVSTRGEASMATIQPEQGVFRFGSVEAIVDFAVEQDMTVRVHDLIGPEVPAWVSNGSWTSDSLSQVLRDHVAAVVGHFSERNPGVVTQWDVVSDAFLADGSPRPTIWQQVIGSDHLRVAFEAARAADPDATLFYDDFYDDLSVTQDAVASGVAIVPGANADRTTCDAVPKCVGVRDAIIGSVDSGVPIDGVGFQAHVFSPDPADFAQLSAWVGDVGLAWAITEFDVPLPVTEITDAASLQFQAEVYAAALVACVDAPNCDTFVTWGVSDRFSPIPADTGGAFGGALWFDADDVPKPAFDAMVDVLLARATPETTVPAPPTTESVSITAPPEVVEESADDSVVVPVAIGVAALVAISAVVLLARRRRATPGPDATNP